jgi:hypothetical protein
MTTPGIPDDEVIVFADDLSVASGNEIVREYQS